MINNIELFKILKRSELHSLEMCEVVEKYIFDRKSITVKINVPKDIVRCQILDRCYSSAFAWYWEKYYEELSK